MNIAAFLQSAARHPLAGYRFPEPGYTMRDKAELRTPDRLTAYTSLLRGMIEIPTPPDPEHQPDAPDVCPCATCFIERAFGRAHDGEFAAELDAHGSAIMFIELGGKPKGDK